jgi:hypothetical protein
MIARKRLFTGIAGFAQSLGQYDDTKCATFRPAAHLASAQCATFIEHSNVRE